MPRRHQHKAPVKKTQDSGACAKEQFWLPSPRFTKLGSLIHTRTNELLLRLRAKLEVSNAVASRHMKPHSLAWPGQGMDSQPRSRSHLRFAYGRLQLYKCLRLEVRASQLQLDNSTMSCCAFMLAVCIV